MSRRVIASGRSCLECRRRKIKCDRSLPCAYCTRTKLQCKYPSRRQNIGPDEEGDLANRVHSIECALKSLDQRVTHIGSMLQVSLEAASRQSHNEHEYQSYIARVQQRPKSLPVNYIYLQLSIECCPEPIMSDRIFVAK